MAICLYSSCLFASETNSLDLENSPDSFYDVKEDYSKFVGRVTDRDKTGNIIKVSSENSNIRFFKAGDKVSFFIGSNDTKRCIGFVRGLEEGHIVLFLQDLSQCWVNEDYFRRGTQLFFQTETLSERIKGASGYRVLLLKRKKDFLKQLNEVNHFVWSFDQHKVQISAEYDKKIVEMEKEKQKAIEILASKKKDQLYLQRELIQQLNIVDRDLDFYRIDKAELFQDRWAQDHDLGLPVGVRPQEAKRN